MPHLRVAVDIGGTFTDICILDQDSGRIRIAKTSSTLDPIDGVMTGLEAGAVDLADVVLFSHGTTVATNALITRRLPRTAMVCTEGFRDVLEIRRANKDDIWDLYKDVAPPYVPRRDRLTVTERIDPTGTVVEPLDEVEAREVARVMAENAENPELGEKLRAIGKKAAASATTKPKSHRKNCKDIIADGNNPPAN